MNKNKPNKEFYRILLNNISDIVTVLSEEGLIQFANNAIENYLATKAVIYKIKVFLNISTL